MHTRTLRRLAAVAALVLAGAAAAQSEPTRPTRPSRRAPTAPGVPPATQPGQPTTPPSATPPATPPAATPPAATPPAATPPGTTAGQTLDEAQKQILGTLHLRYAFDVEAGQLAQSQGQAQQVKDLGTKLATDAQRLDAELAALARERGGDLNTISMPEGERSKHSGDMQKLRGKTGADFDREYVLTARSTQEQYVNDLKAMRDRTPGKDARLKKWLDDAENVAEDHLTAARQAKQALDAQRAAQAPQR